MKKVSEMTRYELIGNLAASRAYAISADRSIRILKEAVQLAYRKHHLDDSSIGWDELSDRLMTALCETMGNQHFQEWLAEVKHD